MDPINDTDVSGEVHFLPESRGYCVCCIDIVNSTEITAGLSENHVRKFYSVFLNTVATIIKSYGAKVIKTTGDGMLFYFPTTRDCEDRPAFQQALECCLALLDERRSINALMNAEGMPPITYRVSADYGTVQIATTNDMFGSTVNICSKINHIARPDGMVIGGDLYSIVNDFKDYDFTEVSSYRVDKRFQYPIYAVHRVYNRAAVAVTHISPAIIAIRKGQSRIMLVDDEDDILTTYKVFLSNAGYPVDAFNDAEEALENFAKSQQYALAILDIRMPKINGLQLFQRIKAMNSKTNVMFVTALDAIDEIKSVLPDSSAAIIKKPVEQQLFVSKVDSLITLAQARVA